MARGFKDVEHTKMAVRSFVVGALGFNHNMVHIATVPSPTQVREQFGVSAAFGGFHLSKRSPSKLFKRHDLIAVGHFALLIAVPAISCWQEQARTIQTKGWLFSESATQGSSPGGYHLITVL